MLATAIIQSSSTLTASLVAMVASGVMPLESAVPMVIGANIGTTVTSLLVSFAQLGSPKAFRRAFITANSHVLFNIVSAVLFFPLEHYFQLLSNSSRFLARQLANSGNLREGWFLFYDAFIIPASAWIRTPFLQQPIGLLVLSAGLLFACIYGLTQLFRRLLLGGSSRKQLGRLLNQPLLSFLSGTGLTAAIHSSSVVTSVGVMLASTEKIAPRKLFPFVMGANVGTTVTALMAAIGKSEAALAIALCHFIFNIWGVSLFFPIPFFRNQLNSLSRLSGNLAQKNLAFAFAYLLVLFFAFPFLVIFLFEKFGS
jgi:sodium-dependent phosphate cotransporter